MVEEPQVVMHEGDEPDAIADFLDPDSLTRQGFTEADLFTIDAESSALSDRDGFVVEGILELTDAGVGAG